MRRSASLFALFLLLASSLMAETPTPHAVRINKLPATTRELFDLSMRLSAEAFDPAVHLIQRPTLSHSNAKGTYMVRESSWYALGLLARDAKGDRETAVSILNTVLAAQYTTPNTRWMGTFKRTPEEQEPTPGMAAFTGYDPNWRQFIGTTFEMILIEYPDRIPADLARRMYAAIDLALQGELQAGRLHPDYSNIALMQGALLDFAAQHNGNADWQKQAVAWTNEVYRLFRLHNTFAEYNSPTYYGTDLYGLGLWRQYGSNAAMRQMGSTMEAALWNDIADFYHPALRNISGAYDRSYGMDMERYVAITGMWIRMVLPAAQAPFPQTVNLSTDHMADTWFTPHLVLLGERIPPAALQHLRSFQGAHAIRRVIDDKRTVTAWIGDNAMWGAEATTLSKAANGPETQFHPATAHWRTPAGSIGWIRLTESPRINAVADKDGITVETAGDLIFDIEAEGRQTISATAWTLPGMAVEVETDGSFSQKSKGAHATLTYRGVHHMKLRLAPAISAKAGMTSHLPR